MKLKNCLLRVGIAALAMFAVGIGVAQEKRNDVTPLSPPQIVTNDGKLEVLEFFAYGCIHCAELEPQLADWILHQPADVRVIRVPVDFKLRGIDSIPLYYTLEGMGLLEKLHQKIFHAANVENVILGNPKILNAWLEKQGVNLGKYEEMQRSFSVQTKINRARTMTASYKIRSTPTIAVNGQYLVEKLTDADRLFGNVERLLADARRQRR